MAIAVPRGRGRRAALIACATWCAAMASANAIAAARSANGTCVASPSRKGADASDAPVHVPVVRIALDQLLQHEGGRGKRCNELDLRAPGRVAPAEGSERVCDEPEHGEREAERDRERRVRQVAVPARGEHVRALVRIGNRRPVAHRMAGECSDHSEWNRNQPRKLTLHVRIVAHERQRSVKFPLVRGSELVAWNLG